MHSNSVSQLQTNFRLSIRRRQVQEMFAQTRKKYAVLQQYEPANQELMKRCLINNGLADQIDQLLPKLAEKIRNHPWAGNIEFVLSICSNVLLDDIQLEQKQHIFSICASILRDYNTFKISPLVEVYFYEVAMGTCYHTLGEAQQMEIEGIFINRLVTLATCEDLDMNRIPSGYSETDVKIELAETMLNGLCYVYHADTDHNIGLPYRIKRTSKNMQQLISWFRSSLKKIEQYPNAMKIIALFNSLLINLTGTCDSLKNLLGKQATQTVIQILILELQYQSEQLQPIKGQSIQCLRALLEDQQTQSLVPLHEHMLKMLMQQLERTVNTSYQMEVLRFFTCLLNAGGQQLESLILGLLSIAADILRSHDENMELLEVLLELIRAVLSKGFQDGNSEYTHYLSNIGLVAMLDYLFVETKEGTIHTLLDDIFSFIDKC